MGEKGKTAEKARMEVEAERRGVRREEDEEG